MGLRSLFHGRYVAAYILEKVWTVLLKYPQDFLDSVTEDPYSGNGHDEGGGSGHTTPTMHTKVRSGSSEQDSLPKLSTTNLAQSTVHDLSVDVVIAPLTSGSNGSLQRPERKSSYANAIQASCIISIWSIEDTRYYTLTFTSAMAAEPNRSSTPTSRLVNRTSTTPQLNKSRSSGSSSSSGRRSGSNSNTASKAVTPIMQQPEFPPRGPPLKSRGDISSSASIFQKATQLKDAILNSINMPAYGKLSQQCLQFLC